MAQVLISYVEEDCDLASGLARGLEESGLTAWYYQRDGLADQSYPGQIAAAIESCAAMVVVISVLRFVPGKWRARSSADTSCKSRCFRSSGRFPTPTFRISSRGGRRQSLRPHQRGYPRRACNPYSLAYLANSLGLA